MISLLRWKRDIYTRTRQVREMWFNFSFSSKMGRVTGKYMKFRVGDGKGETCPRLAPLPCLIGPRLNYHDAKFISLYIRSNKTFIYCCRLQAPMKKWSFLYSQVLTQLTKLLCRTLWSEFKPDSSTFMYVSF